MFKILDAYLFDVYDEILYIVNLSLQFMSERNQRIEQWITANDITEVECLIPDLTGNARGKIIPAAKYCKEFGMRIPEGIFTQTVTGDWTEGSGVVDPVEIDMIGEPDEATLRKLPWLEEPTAQIIHDCYYRDGELVDLAPRSLLKRILALYDAEGWQPIIAPELEFYLTRNNLNPDLPLQPAIGRSGRPVGSRQAYSIDGVNQFDPILDDVYDYCEVLGLDVDTLIHESGDAQMEINFLHGDALSLADQVFMFKRAVREASWRHDICATFMAKPLAGEPGSSMHMHQSVVFEKNRGQHFCRKRQTKRTFYPVCRGPAEIYPLCDGFAGAECEFISTFCAL